MVFLIHETSFDVFSPSIFKIQYDKENMDLLLARLKIIRPVVVSIGDSSVGGRKNEGDFTLQGYGRR